MLVICDNSTLSALAEIGLIHLLPPVVGPIAIPAAVYREAAHPSAPAALREWIARPPVWLSVEPDPACLLEETKCLGPGEAAAITIAWQLRGSSGLIIDEKRGRALAKSLGLPVTGLLAILISAARQDLIDFEQTLASLLAAGFRLAPDLIQQARLKAAQP